MEFLSLADFAVLLAIWIVHVLHCAAERNGKRAEQDGERERERRRQFLVTRANRSTHLRLRVVRSILVRSSEGT